MKEILLSQLIEQTQEAIHSFEHSQSTIYQYQLAWRAISDYFHANHQQEFSVQLAQQYMKELKAKYDAGNIKKWRYKLYRLTTRLLCEFCEQGYLTWGYQKHTLTTQFHQQNYILLQKEYLNSLKKRGISTRTIDYYEIVSRQFLAFLEQQKTNDIAEVRGNDIHLFTLSISKRYQPTSMRTAFSALRSFCRFVESQKPTATCLSNAIPSSWGRKTAIIPTFTPTEEQKLLAAVDCTTPLGKRNYAMLLLALRLGLRSVDIVNLKLRNIHWNRSTIEILQEKTNTALVLPLLTDVGNAIADYILNGRPDSAKPLSLFAYPGSFYQPIRTFCLLWDQCQDHERSRRPAGPYGPKGISWSSPLISSPPAFRRNATSGHFKYLGTSEQGFHQSLSVNRS